MSCPHLLNTIIKFGSHSNDFNRSSPELWILNLDSFSELSTEADWSHLYSLYLDIYTSISKDRPLPRECSRFKKEKQRDKCNYDYILQNQCKHALCKDCGEGKKNCNLKDCKSKNNKMTRNTIKKAVRRVPKCEKKFKDVQSCWRTCRNQDVFDVHSRLKYRVKDCSTKVAGWKHKQCQKEISAYHSCHKKLYKVLERCDFFDYNRCSVLPPGYTCDYATLKDHMRLQFN